ncbi:MAG: CDP-alcohol phosphatidyltransferase family protein [Candidatus Helarchaeota archaeon]
MRKRSVVGKSTDGFISRHLNRKISIRISKFLIKIHPEISPNSISIFCLFLGILGGIFLLLSIPLVGGIILQMASIIDGCDGEIARMKKKSSNFGGFFDSILDRYADCFVLLMIIFYLQKHWMYSNSIFIFIVGMLALAGSLLISYTATKSTEVLPQEFSRTIEGRDFRYFILMLGSILAQFWYFALFLALCYIGCITNIKIIQRIYQIKKKTP